MMAKRTVDNIKLGIFVLAGLLVLLVALYFIGRESNLFGRNFELKARFENVHGLTPGNNVRYAGIQVGTVRKVKILSDTLIEVVMMIDEKMKPFIHKHDRVSISTDGLMGNRLLNITPAKEDALPVEPGDILVTYKGTDTEEMLQTLGRTNVNLEYISEEVKKTILRINQNNALWEVLEDPSIPASLRQSLAQVQATTRRSEAFMESLQAIANDIGEGKGSLGRILKDTSVAVNLDNAIRKLEVVATHADELALELTVLARGVKQDLQSGPGTLHSLLKDSAWAVKLDHTLDNIGQGTKDFQESMEALRHHWLLKGYFRKQEKRKASDAEKSKAASN